MDNTGFQYWQGQELFLFIGTSRPTVGYSHIPIQWVPWIRGVYSDHSHPATPPVYLHFVDTGNIIFTFTWTVMWIYIRFSKNGLLDVGDLSCLEEQFRH